MTALRKYRIKCGLTQADLAGAIGVVPATIAQYESGTRNPDIVKLKKIAAVLHTTTDALLEPIKI